MNKKQILTLLKVLSKTKSDLLNQIDCQSYIDLHSIEEKQLLVRVIELLEQLTKHISEHS